MEFPTANEGMSEKEAEEKFLVWYEEVANERVSMLEDLESYKKRVTELENSNTEILHAFQESQNEIKNLRTKYEPSDVSEGYFEPYREVYEDRQSLIIAEKTYKKRIINLENDLKALQEYVKELPVETKPIKKTQYKSTKNSLVVITSTERLRQLETENQKLRNTLDHLEIENMIAQDKNRSLEENLKGLEVMSSMYANQWGRFHKATKRTAIDDPAHLPKLPEIVPSFRPNVRNDNKSSSSSESHNHRDISAKSNHTSPGLYFGLNYTILHKNRRTLSRRSLSTDTSRSSSYF